MHIDEDGTDCFTCTHTHKQGDGNPAGYVLKLFATAENINLSVDSIGT
jgi:hypothetical protein